jgi:hypothetical protein
MCNENCAMRGYRWVTRSRDCDSVILCKCHIQVNGLIYASVSRPRHHGAGIPHRKSQIQRKFLLAEGCSSRQRCTVANSIHRSLSLGK